MRSVFGYNDAAYSAEDQFSGVWSRGAVTVTEKLTIDRVLVERSISRLIATRTG